MIEVFIWENNKFNKIQGVRQNTLQDEITFDESYDNATVQARNKDSKLCERWSIFLVRTNDENRMYYGSDKVTRIQQSEYYLHTYTLFEPTKYLERFKISGLSVTQPINNGKITLLTFLQRVFADIKEKYNVEFNLSFDYKFRLTSIFCPEFVFKAGTTLFEVLKEVGNVIGAMPRYKLESAYPYSDTFSAEITYDYFDDLKKSINDIRETGYEIDIVNDSASTYLEAEVSNLVLENNDTEASIIYPYKNGWIGLRSDGIRLDDSNANLTLPYNIKKLIKVEVKIPENTEATIMTSPATQSWGKIVNPIGLDITKRIITEDEWLALKEESMWENDIPAPSILMKNSTLYYSINSNAINNLSNVYKTNIFYDSYAITQAVVNTLLTSDNITIQSDNDGLVTGKPVSINGQLQWELKDFLFNIEYIPYFDTTTTQFNPQGKEKGTLTFNQSGQIVNAREFGENMWSELQNQNTSISQITSRYTAINDIKKVGDIIDGKIITSVTRQFTGSKYINVLYKANEEFIRRSLYILENRAYRPYSIPSNTVVERHIHTNEYCVLDYGFGNSPSVVNFTKAGVYLATGLTSDNASLQNKLSEVGNALFTSYANNETKSVFIACVSTALGNSIQFDYGMVDNFSAGKRLYNYDDSVPIVKAVEYSFNGKYDKFNISLHTQSEYINDSNLPHNELPQTTSGTIPASSGVYTKEIPLDKDAGEKITGAVQLHYTTKNPKLIITKYMAINNLAVGGKGYNFKFIQTNEDLNKYSETATGTEIIGNIYGLVKNENNKEYGVVFNISNYSNALGGYWAVVDADNNNLYMAGTIEDLKKNLGYISLCLYNTIDKV